MDDGRPGKNSCLLAFCGTVLAAIALVVFAFGGFLVWVCTPPDIDRSDTKCVFDEMYYDCLEITKTSLLLDSDVGLCRIPSVKETWNPLDGELKFLYPHQGDSSDVAGIGVDGNEDLIVEYGDMSLAGNSHENIEGGSSHRDLLFSFRRRYVGDGATLVVTYRVRYCHALNRFGALEWDYEVVGASGSRGSDDARERYRALGGDKEALGEVASDFDTSLSELDGETAWFVGKVASDYVAYGGTSRFSQDDWGTHGEAD